MIIGIFHQSSGLGNQLHRYIATRVKALELKTDWKMIYNANDPNKDYGFKGKGFIEFDEKKIIQADEIPQGLKQWQEKKIVDHNGVDIRPYDPEFNFIEDNTIIEGEFQDERYWEKFEREVNEWLNVEPINEKTNDNLCVINFRGGEFAAFPELFLPKEYWEEGIKRMKQINPNMVFEVHTDDEKTAQEFFPGYKIIHNIGINWRSIRCAKYAIIANSSFPILPRWLNKGVTIAPRGWARRNTGMWALPQNFYKNFIHI